MYVNDGIVLHTLMFECQNLRNPKRWNGHVKIVKKRTTATFSRFSMSKVCQTTKDTK